MRISISSTFKKGQTAILRLDDDEWYAGTITKVSRDGKVVFEANDEEVYHIDGGDLKWLKTISVAGKKGKYTDAQAKKLYGESETSTPKPKVVENTESFRVGRRSVDPKQKPAESETVVDSKPTAKKPVKGSAKYKKGDKVIVSFDDGLTGPTVVGEFDEELGQVGVWRGRGNLVWVPTSKVKPNLGNEKPAKSSEKIAKTDSPKDKALFDCIKYTLYGSIEKQNLKEITAKRGKSGGVLLSFQGMQVGLSTNILKRFGVTTDEVLDFLKRSK